MTKITKISKVLNLLAKEELTSKEITERIGDKTSDTVSVYLSKLLKDGTIEKTNDKKPYKYKKALTPIELLKQLHKIMDNRMDFTEEPTESEQQIILKIEELIK